MPRVKLTDAFIRALPQPDKQTTYTDLGLPGFGMRVAPGGARTWTVTYHRGRFVRRVMIGRYPLMSLADARARAKIELAKVMQGLDPAAERRAERMSPTFQVLANEYIERHAKPKKRSWAKDVYMLDRYVPVEWFSMKASDITRRDIREHVEQLAKRTPAQANRLLALLRTVWNIGVSRDLVAVSPCARIERPAPLRSRDRVLTIDEIQRIWRAVEHEDAQTAALFQLHFFTAQRGGELRTMRWQDIDLASGWWTVPAERAKNQLAHRVPLSPPALDLVKGLREEAAGSPWLFPARHHSGYRRTPQESLDRVRRRSRVPDFTAHDIRRTVATFLTSELGVSRLVVSKLLNHVETGVTKVYDRATYDAEKRSALDGWAARLATILAAAPPQEHPLRSGDERPPGDARRPEAATPRKASSFLTSVE